jgi:hypothetical protein
VVCASQNNLPLKVGMPRNRLEAGITSPSADSSSSISALFILLSRAPRALFGFLQSSSLTNKVLPFVPTCAALESSGIAASGIVAVAPPVFVFDQDKPSLILDDKQLQELRSAWSSERRAPRPAQTRSACKPDADSGDSFEFLALVRSVCR